MVTENFKLYVACILTLLLDSVDLTYFRDSNIYYDNTASGRQYSTVVKSMDSKPDYQFPDLHWYLIAAKPNKLFNISMPQFLYL